MRSIVFATALTAGVFNPYAPAAFDPTKLNTDLVKFSETLNGDLAKFGGTSVALINQALTPVRPDAAPIDAAASAKVNEDLDYRIAEQTKSVDGWRGFLAAHPAGAHAPSAQAELDKLQPPPPPPPSAELALNTPGQQMEFFRLMERSSANAPEAPTTPTLVEVPVLETKTIVKWREHRTVIYRRAARAKYRSEPSSLPPFLAALFGEQRPPRVH